MEWHPNNFYSPLIHLYPRPNSTLNTQLVQRREKSNSPWSPTNPRATERDGKGPISMKDAPLLAPQSIFLLPPWLLLLGGASREGEGAGEGRDTSWRRGARAGRGGAGLEVEGERRGCWSKGVKEGCGLVGPWPFSNFFFLSFFLALHSTHLKKNSSPNSSTSK